MIPISLSCLGRAIIPRPWKPWCSSPVSVFGGLCGNQSRMDRYRYFIFNQRNMVVLGMFQIAFSTVCVTSGVIDGVFRTESELAKTRAPVWAGMVMGIPGVLALFSSQRKNPVLRFILNAVVKGANIAMLAVSICSAFSVLAMAYLGCRSLPCCSCYDSVTGMEWLQPNEDQNQSVEMICAVESPVGRIFNFTDRFPAQDVDAEEDTSKPPPFIRMT
ncbi:uncharacterized protein LOC120496036 isoform X2 [Passer montanus]|uniref:uncharacterized protein LOC120496036 isoform X2 n=1 Tax=Passer montanus TaxID=9160 RepID=UPI001961E883|nr:uncharacterized protein LOC120496036 isoform X2 [Passer montanus]